ncbi:MAG: DUF2851 family protein [Bacteroidales bacterium]|nr:DUF2851 family protein [Bacteroidales bacterium]
MTEAFLQYVWQHKLLEGALTTVDGLSVVVERPGELNRDAGPDFSDARLVIGGVSWAGNVEVHVSASDWLLHKHSEDRHYDNVILHVVYIHDADITLPNGYRVPTLPIASAIPDKVWNSYDQLMNPVEHKEIPCAPRLKEIPDFLFQLGQDRMIVERMEGKTANVNRLLDESKGHWEQACYWLVAHYFGGKVNAFPFELLAKLTPLTVLAKIKDNAFRVEALLMGQAGLLEGDFGEDYPLALQREYQYLHKAYKLTPLQPHLWKFFRLRPSSFPTLRISQFANLLAQSNNLFSKMLDANDVDTLRALFDVSASDYWTTHYRFDSPTPARTKRLGPSMVDSLIINAWVPLLFDYGEQHGDQRRKDLALTLLQQLPPEKNRIVQMWADEGVHPANAAESQALLQRYNGYCKDKRCLDCQLAFKLIKG